MKKVVFLMVDSLMPALLESGIQSGRLPALAYLFKNGQYWDRCVTVFPTMTATVDCSLITGTYPDRHRIPGLVWYSQTDKRLVDYINGMKMVYGIGWRRCVRDVLYRLNEEHVSPSVPTLFEELSSFGKSSASVNLMFHRGANRERYQIPRLIQRIIGGRRTIHVPEMFSFGAAYVPRFPRPLTWYRFPAMFRKLGFTDTYAIRVMKEMIRQKKQADFSIVYLPDHDHFVHRHPRDAEASLEKVDQKIASLLDQFGSWEKALQHNVFIVAGDHGQTEIFSHSRAVIDLPKILMHYRIAPLKAKVSEAYDLVIANNERMAYIYPVDAKRTEGIIQALAEDRRIDLIAWKDGETVIVEGTGNSLNGRKKELRFRPGKREIDRYGTTWEITGDLRLLDYEKKDGTLLDRDYPDALSRLYGALFAREHPVIAVTARPGYEFASEGAPLHVGGAAHGSLHRLDSEVPLLISGYGERWERSAVRLLDLKNVILRMLDVPLSHCTT